MSNDPEELEALETQITNYAVRRPSQPQSRMKWKDARGEHVVTLPQRALLGSAPSAQIVVSDPTVSRIHAEVDVQPDGVWVRDLGSRNGTFVAGVRVTGGRVPQGGVVRVGGTELRFDFIDEPSNDRPWPNDNFGPLIGRSHVMHMLFQYLSSISASDVSVLIRGETGTGKEVVARAIHDASPRRSQPFVVVDCGAIPENLIESELFGSAKGAFTGALTARVGAVEAADGGTLFFDEIGELPLTMQPKLLRVVESREVRRLGENTSRKVDIRFLSASHRDLRQMVNVGAFREDLYFRLAVLPVNLPPLRERLEDLPALVKHFLPAGSPEVSPELMQALAKRPWLGNVRELRNFIERSGAVGMDRALQMSVAPPPRPLSGQRDEALGIPRAPLPSTVEIEPITGNNPHLPVSTEQLFKAFREQWLDFGEREYVRQLLERHQRKVAAAADAAGLDRTYLYRLIRKHLL